MKEKLEKRLEELQTEFELGQKMLAETEAKEANLRTSMLRISGAMQELQDVIKELEDESPKKGKKE